MMKTPKGPAGPQVEQADQTPRPRPYSTQLRLHLHLLILHFKSGRTLPSIQSQLYIADASMRRTLSATKRDPDVRYAGTFPTISTADAQSGAGTSWALMPRCGRTRLTQ